MIFKRPGSRYWWYTFDFLRRRIQASSRTTNASAARQIEAAHRLRLAKGEAGIVARAEQPTLAQFTARFLADAAERRPRSLRFYRDQTTALLAFPPLGRARLGEIRQPLMARYRAWRRGRVSVASTNRALATLRRMLRLAAEWELIAAAPRVQLLAGERPREFVLPRQSDDDYFEAFAAPARQLLIVMTDTGLRPGEAVALRRADLVQPSSGPAYLRVRREVAKRERPRAVPLTRRALAAILELPEDGPALFGRQCPTVDRLQKLHRRVRAKLGWGPEFVVHSLRHTALTRLGESGADAFTIAAIAGHASIATTGRYVHPVPEALARAVQRGEDFATGLTTVQVRRPPKRPNRLTANS